jgi:hypothetical protein
LHVLTEDGVLCSRTIQPQTTLMPGTEARQGCEVKFR